MAQSDTYGPESADFLEMQGAVGWIGFEQRKTSVSCVLGRLG
jgi:hypothetical protein